MIVGQKSKVESLLLGGEWNTGILEEWVGN